MKVGLIGFPLNHSFSPTYFNEKFFREGIKDCTYESFAIAKINQLPELLKKQPGLVGLNVTIPYKESVIPYLDTISEEAKTIGAVNTIKIRNALLQGFNTDAFGFQKSLEPLLTKGRTKALVLGTGGSAKAVCYVLNTLNIEFQTVSRTAKKNLLTYQLLTEEIIADYQLIINCTPLGMAPDIYSFPDIPYHFITKNHLLFDMVYNPAKSIFLIKGEMQGARIKNGLEMLYLQAEKSWEIWNT